MIDEKMQGRHLPEEHKLTCIPARQESPSSQLLKLPRDFHTHIYHHQDRELLVTKNRDHCLENY